MTMIDEKSLEHLLARAAEEIDVPVDGAAGIEAAAESLERRVLRLLRPAEETGDEGDDHTARTARTRRAYRVAAVAASVLVAGLIAAATLGHVGSSGPRSPSAAQITQSKTAVGDRQSAAGAARGAGQAAAAEKSPSTSPGRALSGAGTPGALGSLLPPNTGSSAGTPGSVARQTGSSGSDVAGPKIESTGSMDLTVPNLDTAVSALTTLVAGDGGFVAAEQTQSASPGVPASGTVTLQVPQTSFSALVDQVKRLGVSSQVSTKQVDVTGQYVDLQAQITALRATQQQYLTIMTKAQSIGDILAVQQQLDSINSQLQQVEGELNLLDSQTAYGTLTVALTEPGPKLAPAPAPKPAPKPPTGLAAAWGSARHGFADGVYWVVRQTGGLAFLILLAGLLYLLGRVGRRGLRRLAL
jgi:hypothetical protein